MSADHDHAELLNAWAHGLQASLRGNAEIAARPGLRLELLARVAASAQAHAQYRTLRREASPWLPAGDGARLRWLRQDTADSVALLSLGDGAALPETPGAVAVEYLLTEGGLHHPQQAVDLSTWSHTVQAPDAAQDLRARGPATVYRRTLNVPVANLPNAESRWWQARLGASATAALSLATGGTGRGGGGEFNSGWQPPGAWLASRAGVQVLPLAVHRHVVSMLVRFEAGAGVPDHGHEIDEDCLVLAGEMFLGDILLRAGDYQLAPAGGSHFGETSDCGATFYFHGALDSTLRPPR